jgi:hypothetical protein
LLACPGIRMHSFLKSTSSQQRRMLSRRVATVSTEI